MAKLSLEQRIEAKRQELQAKEAELNNLNEERAALSTRRGELLIENNNLNDRMNEPREKIKDLEHDLKHEVEFTNSRIERNENLNQIEYEEISKQLEEVVKNLNSDDIQNLDDDIGKISDRIESWIFEPSTILRSIHNCKITRDELKSNRYELRWLENRYEENEKELNSIHEQLITTAPISEKLLKDVNTLKRALQRLLDSQPTTSNTSPSLENMQDLPQQESWRPLSIQEKIDRYKELCEIATPGLMPFYPVGNSDAEKLASIEHELKRRFELRLDYAISKNPTNQRLVNASSPNSVSSYKKLLSSYFGSDYETFKAKYSDYLHDIGASEKVKNEMLRLYSPKLFNASPPPAMFLSRNNNGAFHGDGCIFMNNNDADWNGSRFTASHEAGHYFDNNVFRGEAYKHIGAQSNINKASERIKQRLTQRGAKFKLFGREFTLSQWKAGFEPNGNNYRIATSSMRDWINTEIQSRFGFHPDSPESKELRAQIFDTFQSIFGFTYGAGHDRHYNHWTKDTSVEAVANIFSMISNGYDFIREPLMELYDEIYKEMK